MIYEKEGAIATILSTSLTILGTAAALAYYFSFTSYASSLNFFLFMISYIFFIGAIYHLLMWRYKHVG